MLRLRLSSLIVAVLLGFMIGVPELPASTPAWGDSGATLCGFPPCLTGSNNLRPLSDERGGALFIWDDGREPGDRSDIYATRLGPTGSRLEPWPANGLLLAGDPNSQRPWGLHPDGQGSFFALWTDFYPFEQHVDCKLLKLTLDGLPAPGWPAEGLRVSLDTSRQDAPQLISDGSGGAYVVWDDERHYTESSFSIYLQRVTADGQIAPGWPRDGLPICRADGDSYPFAIVPDGEGGALCVWNDFRPSSTVTSPDGAIYGLRVLPDGSYAPGWNVDGNLLLADRTRPAVASDGLGGFFLGTSVTGQFLSDVRYYAHRFTRDGTLVPDWPAEGIVFCEASDFRDHLQATQDDMGGVLFSWSDYRSGVGVYLTRLQPDGAYAPGWVPHGTRVNDPASVRNDFTLSHLPDGRGGAYVLYESGADDGAPAIVARMGADGAPAADWPPYGVRLAVTRTQSSPRIASDGNHGVIASWEETGGKVDGVELRIGAFANLFRDDVPVAARISLVRQQRTSTRVDLEWYGPGAGSLPNRVERRTEDENWVTLGPASIWSPDRLGFVDSNTDPARRYAYRLAYRDDGGEQFTAETWVDVPALALSLSGFRPNPAVGVATVAFSLPDDRPARLDVIDVKGRIVRTRDVGSLGRGSHVLPFASEAPLGAGMYWIRLNHPERTLTVKGLVLR